jgi:arylsulfatase A-like enzyme
VVAELKQEGQLDNTLVFFLQDNGACAENMGREAPKKPYRTDLKPMKPDDLQPKIWPPMQTRDGRPVRTGPEAMPGPADTYVAYGKSWANVSDTPFREYKHWVHEGGIATPLIVHWPNGIPHKREGRTEAAPGHIVDLMATCVDVANANYPREQNGQSINPLAGVSLRPALQGRSLHRAAPLYWEHEGNRALREGKWKIVAKGPGGAWELYDMEADRTERVGVRGIRWNCHGPPHPGPLLPRREAREKPPRLGRDFLNSMAVHPSPLPGGEGATQPVS